MTYVVAVPRNAAVLCCLGSWRLLLAGWRLGTITRWVDRIFLLFFVFNSAKRPEAARRAVQVAVRELEV